MTAAFIRVCTLFWLGLSACGPADDLFDPKEILPAASEQASQPLRLLSYNVQARPVLDALHAQKRMQKIAAILVKEDIAIAALQESFVAAAPLKETKGPFPHQVHFETKSSPIKITHAGLRVLSRYRIEDARQEHYQAAAGLEDQVASKGMQLIYLDIAGMPLDLIHTHMEAGPDASDQGARRAQARQLQELIANHSRKNVPLIVLGDFNMSPQRPGRPFEQFSPNHYRDDSDRNARTTIFSSLLGGTGLRDLGDTLLSPKRDHINRILYRQACGYRLHAESWLDLSSRFRDDEGQPLSDSMPLLGTFTLEKTADTDCTPAES